MTNRFLGSSGSEPASSLLPAVRHAGGSRPGPDKRGEQGATAGLIGEAVSPAPPIRESARGGHVGLGSQQAVPNGLVVGDSAHELTQGGGQVAPSRALSPPVGEGVSGDFLGTAAGAGTAAPPRRIVHDMPRITGEMVKAIEGESCWRCGEPAVVAIKGGVWFPYCEQHGSERAAADIRAALLDGHLKRAHEELARVAGKLKRWEKKVLRVPGAAERVAEVEEELRRT